MFTKVRNRMESDEGFTLIELLVVILIIGILAAIAIPSFLNQRVKGQDACAKSMARTMQTAMETLYVDNNSYASGSATTLAQYENQITTPPCGGSSTLGVGLTGVTTTGSAGCTGTPTAAAYCVYTTSASGNSFSIARSSAGVITRGCALATGQTAPYGGCLTGNSW